MITHENVAETIRSLTSVVSVGPTDRFLSFLPLSHIAERCTSHLGQIISGGETWFARSLATAGRGPARVPAHDLLRRAAGVGEVPAGRAGRAGACPRARARPGRRAWSTWGTRSSRRREGTAAPAGVARAPGLRERSTDAGRPHPSPDGARPGPHLRVVGGARSTPTLLRWFHAIGIPIAEVYGQTEDCGPTTMNRPGRIRIGTVGEPLPGLDVRIAADGEVLVRGPNVCAGYWNDPEATAALLDDGWMHSGDLGALDGGYLRIIGRKKDLIVTSSGKNIAPQDMETHLRSRAVHLPGGGGRRRPQVPDRPDRAGRPTRWRRPSAVRTATARPRCWPPIPLVEREITAAVERLNAGRAPAERIKAWRILPRELTVAGGELTPTLKVKRAVVVERFDDLVEEMYAR